MFKLFLFLLLAAPAAGAPIVCGTTTGDFKVAGSTTIYPIVVAVAAKWNVACPKSKVTVFGGGSGQGVQAACNGTVAIGTLSRPIRPTEATGKGSSYTCVTGKKGGLIEFKVAYDGVVVAATKGSDGDKCITALGGSLSIPVLKSIFGGAVATWNKVAPACSQFTSPITIVGSDTAQTSYQLIEAKIGKIGPKFIQLPEKDISAKIISTKNSIGFLPLDYYQFKAAQLNVYGIGGVKPIPTTTIQSGAYPFKRVMNFAVDKPSLGKVQSFVRFLLSTDGQAIVTTTKLVALTEADRKASLAVV